MRVVSRRITITSLGSILPGTVSTTLGKCGTPTCHCHRDHKYLHGPYYRCTGWMNGRPITKTVSEEMACDRWKRIDNYKELQKKSHRPSKTLSTMPLGCGSGINE